MRYTYTDSNFAQLGSPIIVNDAMQVARFGAELLGCFERYGVEDNTAVNAAFEPFHEALYGAGFVMGNFDGPTFENGPMHLLFIPEVAPLVVRASNLLTIRMFFHTLSRGHRAVYYSSGCPYFDRAFLSGGLKALIKRVDKYCTVAIRHDWTQLQDAPELQTFRTVEP